MFILGADRHYRGKCVCDDVQEVEFLAEICALPSAESARGARACSSFWSTDARACMRTPTRVGATATATTTSLLQSFLIFLSFHSAAALRISTFGCSCCSNPSVMQTCSKFDPVLSSLLLGASDDVRSNRQERLCNEACARKSVFYCDKVYKFSTLTQKALISLFEKVESSP